jgi:hypothetical protein
MKSSEMHVSRHELSPPSLEELADVLRPALDANYKHAEISVERCPDLRSAPFHLAAEGICGDERIADIGGETNLYPIPHFDRKYSMIEIAQEMQMSPESGQLLGAGAGPFHRLGTNAELSPNLSWSGSFDNVTNGTYYTKIDDVDGKKSVVCAKSPTTDCALMANLYGSSGLPGEVLKITARARKGDKNAFHELIRDKLVEHYGESKPVSMGGVFVIKRGRAYFHVMPDFPPKEDLPFKDVKQLEKWLTWHEFDASVVCLSVFHSADPEKLGLRKEHTHCFSTTGDRGGHYHYDLAAGDSEEEIEYEAYFNTAKELYRIDRPQQKSKD